MEEDWDLHAVVRGCVAAASSTAVEDSQPSTTSKQYSEFPDAWFQDLFEPNRKISTIDLVEESLSRPFITIAAEHPPTVSDSQQILPIPQNFIKTELQQKQLPLPVPVPVSALKHSSSPSPRYKKRKNQVKKRVCRVPPEGLSSDVWSWRKYGQKPIKGSPFPRGYYKCSTLKGCMARKQVERDRSDPGMFIVTYTAEHNHPSPTHRSSFAGITRQKPISPENPAAAAASPEKKCSSREDLANDDGDDFRISDMALDDDFFVGLEDFTSNDGGGCSTDREDDVSAGGGC